MVKEAYLGFLEQAKKVQETLEAVRAQIYETEVIGESGAGLVRVTLDGKYQARKVYLDPSVLQEKKEVIEELVAAAMNDATIKLERLNKEKFSAVMPGLPTGFKWPF